MATIGNLDSNGVNISLATGDDGDVGAALGHAQRDSSSAPASASSYDGHFAIQSKVLKQTHDSLFPAHLGSRTADTTLTEFTQTDKINKRRLRDACLAGEVDGAKDFGS